jgi:restriction system protein
MARQTLFSTLLGSPWWLSLAIAAGLFAGLRLALPALVAASAALPFAAIGCYAAWRQLRVPGESAVAERLAQVRQLGWERFSGLLAEGLRRDGYEVQVHRGTAADYELRRGGRTALASCKRWKVTQAGVGPLRELVEARGSREADECVFVTAGELTPQARSFAREKAVRLIEGAELVRLVGRIPEA